MKEDDQLERILAAERAWTEAVSRTDETSRVLCEAIGEALPKRPDADELDAQLEKLNDCVSSALASVNEFTAKLLNASGDDAQLANVDLQNILQKQQQTLQMMSNVSKMLYDTAQSVIRKMGG